MPKKEKLEIMSLFMREITIDHENIIQAEQILLLNGFIKKSTKDYKKEINKSVQILNNLQK